MARANHRRQWLQSSFTNTMTVNSPVMWAVLSDPQNTWDFDGRIVRMLVNVGFATRPDFNANAGSLACLGLIYQPTEVTAQPALASSGLYDPLKFDDSDAGWMWRSYFRLPYTHIPDGPVDMRGDNYHLDWPIHGGKGTNLVRDNMLTLVGSWGGLFGGAGSLDIFVTALILVEAVG